MNNYENLVEPRLDEIEEWASKGATIAEMSEALGIGEAMFYVYQKKYPELKIAVINGKQSLVPEIKKALLKKALGFTYTERKTTTKTIGEDVAIVEEEYEKYCAPSEQAANILLRNIDDSFIDRDRTTMNMKEQELEIKKKIAENKDDMNFFAPGCVNEAPKEEKKKTKYDTI